MSNKVEMTGFVTAQMKVRVVGDLRALVRWLDKYKVSDSREIDWGSGNVYVELTGETPTVAEWIECGEHVPPDIGYDLILPTHDHHKKPSDFDWPTKDKLKEAYKRMPDTYEDALEQALDRYNVEGRPE